MKVFELAGGMQWAIQEDYLQRILGLSLTADLPADQAAQEVPTAVAQLGPRLQGTHSAIHLGPVALLPIIGPIFPHNNVLTRLISIIFGATILENLTADFKAASASPEIALTLLYIDSPGGRVEGIGEFADLVYDSPKPVVAYGAGAVASAAYWIGSAADRSVISPSSWAGSIGVALSTRKNSDPDTFEIISSQSPNKRLDPTTESGLAGLQKLANDTADVFIQAVARNRNVSVKTVLEKFGGGGLLVGQLAVDAGLADAVGSFDSVLAEMKAGKLKRRKKRMSAAADDNTLPEAGEYSGGLDMSEKKEKGFFARLFSSLSAEEKEEAAKLLASEGDGKGKTALVVDEYMNVVATKTVPQNAEKPAEPDSSASTDEVTRLKAQVAQLQEDRFRSAAESFANNEILAGRAMPAEKDAIIAAHVQAAKDDADRPVAGGKSRVALLTEAQAKRPAHQLTREQMKARMSSATVLADSEDPEAKAIEEERKETRAWAEKQNGNKQKTA